MPLYNYNKKFLCGPPISSSCVYWDGQYNTVVDRDILPCNASVEEVIDRIAEIVEEINTSLDLSLFNPGTIDFDKDTQQVKDLLQLLADEINSLKAITASLQTQIDNIKAGDIEIEMDLGCLQNEINNCETPPTYTLVSLLTLFKDQICLLKS